MKRMLAVVVSALSMFAFAGLAAAETQPYGTESHPPTIPDQATGQVDTTAKPAKHMKKKKKARKSKKAKKNMSTTTESTGTGTGATGAGTGGTTGTGAAPTGGQPGQQ